MTVVTSFPITLNPTSAFIALGAAPTTGDLIPMVDIDDPTQASTGSLKKMTVGNLFTSPTFTGTTTAASLVSTAGVQFTGGTYGTPGSIFKDTNVSADGLVIEAAAGSVSDFTLYTPAGGLAILTVPTGTRNLLVAVGNLTLTSGNIVVTAGSISAPTAAVTALTLGSTTLLSTSVTLTNAAGVSVGTITNAPHSNNPDKWVQFNDNGTVRAFPAWNV